MIRSAYPDFGPATPYAMGSKFQDEVLAAPAQFEGRGRADAPIAF